MINFIIWCHTNQRNKSRIIVLLALFSFRVYSQSIGITSPVSSTSYCAGSNVTITFTTAGVFSNTPTNNVFSAEISDVGGSFAGSPVSIGTRTAITAGPITCTLPSTLLTSGLYRFRITSSNPAVNGSDNGANLTIISISLNSPTVTQNSFCQGETFTVNFSQTSCNFVNIPANNVYSVQLSDAAGSFTNPILLGTRTGTTAAAITCTLPPGTPAGTAYRMRMEASSPAVTGPDNGANLTVMAAAGTPSVYGNGKWNIYCYNTRNDYVNNYQGFYTENNLSFNTATRWVNTLSPSTATAGTGLAYSGCSFGNTNYSLSFKRTNIPCGYYQIDIPSHRTEVIIYLNGAIIFQHNAFISGEVHTNVWTGIIEPADEIECRFSSAATGFLAVTFNKLNQLTMSPAVTICSVSPSSTSLTATNTGTVPVTYAWLPSVSLSPSTGTAVTATPTITTVYTVTATDAGGTGCPLFTNTVTVTVNALPTTTTTINTGVICSGNTSAVITATGANTYSWSPAAGLNTTTGNVVSANPTVTTVYTVTGSNNCTTTASARTVTVKTVPSSPTPTAAGNGAWNVYCYNGAAFNTYYGFYTEVNVNFSTVNRWAAASSPSVALAVGASSAYVGCNLINAGHSTVHKRTNFTCGYYSVNLTHDDYVTMLVDNVTVFTHTNSTADTDLGAWIGFLGAASTVEFRHTNATGNSLLTASFVPVPVPSLSPPVTICAGTTATLTAANIAGVGYSWTPTANLSPTTGTMAISSTSTSTNYTCTIMDAVTNCTASATTSVTINFVPTTTISATASTINCQAQTYTLTASGANTYSWSPSTGLSATSGNSVIASPTVNITYTVVGNNNCSSLSATTNVIVVPLVSPTVFPTGTWNAYCYNSTTFTNYFGYYTENGSGTSGYDFNTATRWVSGASPSTTNTSTGQAYQGCPMPTTNWSISFKRTGFTCKTYSITLMNNDDAVTIFVNGAQVATRSAASTATAVMWVGVLSPSTTLEFRLVQSTTGSGLNMSLTPAPSNTALSTWSGATSSDWFTANNWCGSIPISSSDVLIYRTGTLFQPSITGSMATCNDLTIAAAAAATSSTSALTAASLSMTGSYSLNVYGDWLNYGTFIPGSGTVSILGSGTKSITSAATQTFNSLAIDNNGNVEVSNSTTKINSSMNLVSGIVDLNGGVLHFLNGATVAGASNTSYIDGRIVKFGSQPFTFPIGLGGLYRPISISAPVSITDNFTAEYFYANPSPPYTSTSKDVTIDHISACEYWLLNRTGGSSIVYVTLSWDVASCGVSSLPDLLVARWDAGQVKWKDHGNGAVTGNTVTGTVISSAPVSVFSPFTLGSRNALNVLPIELLDFSASCVENGIQLTWQVGSEFNNDHFIIERSSDGNSWKEISTIPSQGNTSSARSYRSLDTYFTDETVYYRLSQVDLDLQKKTFKTISSHCRNSQPENFRFYPNPAQKEINLVFNATQEHLDGSLTITDHLGRPCMAQHLDLKKGANILLLPIHLQPGIYFIAYASGTFRQVHKLVIQ